MKRAACTVLCLLLLAGVTAASSAPVQWIRVKWVVDGDTIVLSDGRHVRYIGLNAPEIEHDQAPAEAFGVEAQALNRQLVFGQRIRMEFDHEKKDSYGRWLAYVLREDGLFINEVLVQEGLAHVLNRNPNVRKAQVLLEAQRGAMSAQKGMWRQLPQAGKGSFIGSRRSLRFHAPNCPESKKIHRKNRILFNSAWDAFWQGYAPAKGCISGMDDLLNIKRSEESGTVPKKGGMAVTANPP